MQPETERAYRGNLDKLVQKVNAERGLDLGQYRPAYVERRLAARLRTLGLHSYRQYAAYLDTHPDEYAGLLDTLTINVTDWYRDKPVYDMFANQIVPTMLADKLRARQRMLRVWCAGCATGEEPYSVAMTLLEAIAKGSENFMLSVTGTDIDPAALKIAAKAEYAIDRMSHIPQSHRLKYIEVRGDRFVIKPAVTACVKFRQMNLFEDRPPGVADLIFCRNVFIYFNREQQDRVLEKFWAALHKGGYLVLGRSEKLSADFSRRFELVSGRDRIYRKPQGS